MRRLGWLQHIEFEDLGNIAGWARARDFRIDVTRLFAGEALPKAMELDWLVVMGGPMSVHDADAHPWLPRIVKQTPAFLLPKGARITSH